MKHLVAPIFVTLALATSAGLAQNALGDGRALDGGLNALGRFNDARPDFASEIRFRNSIVTGNAANGLSFRGDVGYTAAGDFRGTLGSNELFAFRRDSLVSGLAGGGIRGTDALQFQMALTTGSRPPQDLIGGFAINQSGAGASSSQFRSMNGVNPGSVGLTGGVGDNLTTTSLLNRPANDPAADQRGQVLWSIRSTAVNTTNRSLQPAMLGYLPRTNANDPLEIMTASTLRGVQLSPAAELTSELSRPAGPKTLTPAEKAQEERGSRGVAPSYQTLFEQSQSEFAQKALDARNALKEAATPESRGPETAEQALQIERQTLQQYLRGQLRSTERGDGTGDGSQGDKTPTPRDVLSLPGLSAQSIELLRSMREQRQALIDRSFAGRDVYAEHMVAGQDLLASGKYFDAEGRFAAAVSIKQGDVSAQIGRLHAQIGAAAYVSASFNLKELYTTHPEAIPLRFGAELLPTGDRWDVIRGQLNAMLNDQKTSLTLAHDSSLVLAYMAYQMGDAPTRLAALARFEETIPPAELDPSNGSDQRLVDLLRSVWAESPEGVPPAETPE